MSKLLQGLLQSAESSNSSALSRWRQKISDLVDTLFDESQYLTQNVWYIDSANGNDDNTGLTQEEALKSLAELTRRWAGRTFSPTVSQVNVYLYGTFPLESLVANATSATPLVITFTGRTTAVDSGSVTSYQAWNSASDLRAQLTDSSQDFTGYLQRWRVRLTSGTGVGALTWIGSTSGATVANVGQFRTTTYPTGSEKTPAPGDTYVIETLDTSILQYEYRCSGPVRVELYDLDVSTKAAYPAAGGLARCMSSSPPNDAYMRVLGCSFGVATGSDLGIRGSQQWVSCSIYGPAASSTGLYIFEGVFNIKSLCGFSSLHIYRNVVVTAAASMHDGNGTHYVGVNVQEGSIYRTLSNTFDAFFGCVGGVGSYYEFLVRASNGSQVIYSSSYLWGASGNTVASAVEIENGCGLYYTAAQKPKATGGTPGNDIKLAGAAAVAWSTIPAVATAPNNAACLEKT